MQLESFELEVQRRQFWSWYIMHCHNGEGFGVLDAAGNVAELPLPWSEDEFAACSHTSSTNCLITAEGSTSVFAELVRLMTFW
jgi:hypothetical protein